MGGSPRAQSFKDLLVYEKTHQTSQTIFEISKEFPKLDLSRSFV